MVQQILIYQKKTTTFNSPIFMFHSFFFFSFFYLSLHEHNIMSVPSLRLRQDFQAFAVTNSTPVRLGAGPLYIIDPPPSAV